MVLGIAPVAIIDRQLPFEYTITSRSTDVVVMALPVQNINHSAFRSMFEREKLSGNNFNDWFRQLKLVLRVEKKMYVIEQPLPAAPAADSQAQVLSQWNAVYDAYNEVACLILGSMTPELHRQFENSSPYDMIKELKSMFEKQAGVERFDLIQTFHACKQEEGKPVAAYVIQMKGYVDQLERLGYMLPQDLIEKDKQVYIPKPKNPKPSAKEHPTKDDTCHHCKEVGNWKRNCPVYLVELLKKQKQVGSVSSLGIFTIELFAFPNKSRVYDTGCGTHICITKQGFREARKLKQGALYVYVGNGIRAQVEAIGSYDLVLPNDLVIYLDNCHYAPSITRGVVSVHRLVENGFVQRFTDFRISVSKNNVFYFNVIPNNGIYEIDMHDLVPNVNSIYNVSTKRAKHNLDSTYLWHCRLAHISKKRIEKLQQEGLLKSIDDESFDQCGCEALVKRDTPDKLQQRSVKCIFIGYLKEKIGYYFYFPPENKIVVTRYAEFFEKNLITQEVSGRAMDLQEIQDEDTSPFEITGEIPMEVEEAKEHSLGDLNEPTSYKAATLDSESNKWIDAMNAEIQSMMDNMVWVLVDLPPSCKTVRSKWIFKKKTDMDGIVHTYKAHLISKGYTQLYGVDYEETFSPVADIRAIRIGWQFYIL
ncbi:retrotransposon protein, putative, ty1-copia subclass [Tanacetum coccineum]